MSTSSLFRNDARYPRLLAEIFDPPSVFYYQGDWSSLERPCVAIVGTRRSTAYGEQMAFNFAKTLAEWGITIVSGLAFGIDAAAHKGALAGGGSTVAVVAQPLSCFRPATHAPLARKILEQGGALLSEKEEGSTCFPSDYLVRNRLIAGLCLGTLVVEAGFPSGALNTAAHALREGRDLFVLPGRITDAQSQGCFKLLKEGAFLVTRPQEIALELKLPFNVSVQKPLGALAERLFRFLYAKPASAAELAEHFSDPLSQIYSVLADLELQHFIRVGPNGRYLTCSPQD